MLVSHITPSLSSVLLQPQVMWTARRLNTSNVFEGCFNKKMGVVGHAPEVRTSVTSELIKHLNVARMCLE